MWAVGCNPGESRSKRIDDPASFGRVSRLLRQAKDDGLPIEPRIERLRFEDGAKDLINDYTINGKKSLDEAVRRVAKHLKPFFGGRRLTRITTADVRSFITERQKVTIVTGKGESRRERPVSNAESIAS